MNKFKGLIMSQRVLLALTQGGLSRDESYKIVQRNAMLVWNEGKNFETELLNDNDVLAILSKDEIRAAFDLSYHTKHVDFIFNRVFNT